MSDSEPSTLPIATCCAASLTYNAGVYHYVAKSLSVHILLPSHTDYDCILHVNPYIENRGLAMVYNPTLSPCTRNISLPLYYTGIANKALVLHEGRTPGTEYALERDYTITLSLNMTAQSITWYLIKSAD